MDDQLISYIKQSLGDGFTKEQIMIACIEAGYNETVFEEAYTYILESTEPVEDKNSPRKITLIAGSVVLAILSVGGLYLWLQTNNEVVSESGLTTEVQTNTNAVTDKRIMNLSGFVANPGLENTFYSSSPYIKTNVRIENEFADCTERLLLVGDTEIITPELDINTRIVRPNAMGSADQSYLDGTWFIPEEYFDRSGSYLPRVELDCESKVYADEYTVPFTFTNTDEKSNSRDDSGITLIPLTADGKTTYSYGDQIRIRFTVLGLDTLPSGNYSVMSALSDGSNEYFGVGFPFEITDSGRLPTFSATTFTLQPGVKPDKQCTEEDLYFQAILSDPDYIQQAADQGIDMNNLSEVEFKSVCDYVTYGSIPAGVYRQGVAIVDEDMNVVSIEQGEPISITE